MQHPFAEGDHVTIQPGYSTKYAGVVFRVTKANPKTVLMTPIAGGPEVKAVATALLKAPKDGDEPGAAVRVELPTFIPTGAVVTVAGVGSPKWKFPPEQLFVVLRESGQHRYAVAPLGGGNGTYWRLPPSVLTVVDPARLQLAAA